MTEIAFVFRLLLAALFLSAGVAKFARRTEFQWALERYQILPWQLVRPVSRTLPIAEVIVGVLLAVGLLLPLAAISAAALLVAFAGAVAINLLRGREIDCGCLGITAQRVIGWPLVARNLVLAGAALLVAGVDPRLIATDALLSGDSGATPTWSDVVPLVTLAVASLAAVAIIQEGVTLREVVRRHESVLRS